MLDSAKWIAHAKDMGFECPVFKKEFRVDKKIENATVTATARGCYYAELNGKRIGDFIFAPGCTSLKRVQAQTYDITDMLLRENKITVILSKGWYRGRIDPRGSYHYKDMPEAFIAEIRLTYEDGTQEAIVPEESWESSAAKVRFADFYDGEHYDATYEEYHDQRLRQENTLRVFNKSEKSVEPELAKPRIASLISF